MSGRTGKKPSLQIRKPGQTSARDASITGGALEALTGPQGPRDVQTSEPLSVQTSERSEVQMSGSSEEKEARAARTIIHVNEDVYRRLEVQCALLEIKPARP